MKAGWEVKPLGEVCNFENGDRGKNYPGKKCFVVSGVPFINAGLIDDGKILWDNMNFIPEDRFELLSRGKIQSGDFLFCLRGSLGKFGRYISDKPAAIASSLVIIRPNDEILASFFAYYLRSEHCAAEIVRLAAGAAQPNLGANDLKQFTVPIPPLEEQRRIVAVLDAAFEGLTRAEENAKANLKNARELFEAQLKEQFDPLPKMWTRKRLDEICSKIGSGATPRGGKNAYKVEGISLVRSLNIHDREFRHKGLAFIDIDQARKLSIVTVEQDDVLLNITGASVARCAQIDNTVLPARVNQHVAIIRPIEGTIIPRFLCYELTSEPYKKALLKTGEDGGATRQAITKTQIQDLIVGYPIGKVEQNRICEKLMNAEKFSLELKAIYRTKLTDIADLRQSLLQKAFAGELT